MSWHVLNRHEIQKISKRDPSITCKKSLLQSQRSSQMSSLHCEKNNDNDNAILDAYRANQLRMFGPTNSISSFDPTCDCMIMNAHEGVLKQLKQLSTISTKKHVGDNSTLILLDWDDTLFPTTGIFDYFYKSDNPELQLYVPPHLQDMYGRSIDNIDFYDSTWKGPRGTAFDSLFAPLTKETRNQIIHYQLFLYCQFVKTNESPSCAKISQLFSLDFLLQLSKCASRVVDLMCFFLARQMQVCIVTNAELPWIRMMCDAFYGRNMWTYLETNALLVLSAKELFSTTLVDPEMAVFWKFQGFQLSVYQWLRYLHHDTVFKINDDTSMRTNDDTSMRTNDDTSMRTNDDTSMRTNDDTSMRTNDDTSMRTSLMNYVRRIIRYCSEHSSKPACESVDIKSIESTSTNSNSSTSSTTNTLIIAGQQVFVSDLGNKTVHPTLNFDPLSSPQPLFNANQTLQPFSMETRAPFCKLVHELFSSLIVKQWSLLIQQPAISAVSTIPSALTVVSIGDSHIEESCIRRLAQVLNQDVYEQRWTCKSIKLATKPTLDTVYSQLNELVTLYKNL